MIAQEPKIMPFQDEPFNGDKFIQEEFLKLKHRFNLTTAVETGTALGSTTLFLSNNFEKVYTIEINKTYYDIAVQKFISHKNIFPILGTSPNEIFIHRNRFTDKTIFFLDAHWYDNCPLKFELTAIRKAGLKPVIAIHDFYVPGSAYSKEDKEAGLGFDSYKDQPFTFEWIKPELDAIYGADNYDHYYNSEATGAKRGIIYITPK